MSKPPILYHGLVPPGTPLRHRQAPSTLPFVLPQTAYAPHAPFVRGYTHSLAQFGVGEARWLAVVDGVNRALAPRQEGRVVYEAGRVGAAVAAVAEVVAPDGVDLALEGAGELARYGSNAYGRKTRTRTLDQVNDGVCHPAGLHVDVLTTEQLHALLRLPPPKDVATDKSTAQKHYAAARKRQLKAEQALLPGKQRRELKKRDKARRKERKARRKAEKAVREEHVQRNARGGRQIPLSWVADAADWVFGTSDDGDNDDDDDRLLDWLWESDSGSESDGETPPLPGGIARLAPYTGHTAPVHSVLPPVVMEGSRLAQWAHRSAENEGWKAEVKAAREVWRAGRTRTLDELEMASVWLVVQQRSTR